MKFSSLAAPVMKITTPDVAAEYIFKMIILIVQSVCKETFRVDM